MGTPKKLLNMVRLSSDNFDLIRYCSNITRYSKKERNDFEVWVPMEYN